MKKLFFSAALAAGLMSAPAQAADTIACDVTLPSPNAVDCAGYFDGNLVGGSPSMRNAQIAALAELGYTYDGDWSSVEPTLVLSLQNGNQIDFGQMMYGMTYIAAHFGNVAGPAGNVTVFWAFDFGTQGAQFVSLSDTQGFSNAVLFSTGVPAVPEPSTWMMLLLGFGAVGAALRKNRKTANSPARALA